MAFHPHTLAGRPVNATHRDGPNNSSGASLCPSIILLIAGLLEVVAGRRPEVYPRFFRPDPPVITITAMVISMALLPRQ